MKKIQAILAIVLTLTMTMPIFAQGKRQAMRALGRGARPAPPAAGREMLIKNATIMTASHGTIKNGAILVRDGKIAAVGVGVNATDANALVIDATGKYVTPGIIDCHSHTAVEGSVNEGSLSVTSMVRIQDVIDPYAVNVYRELAGGLVTCNILHGSANAIGGQNAVVKLKKGKPVEEWLIKDAPPGIKFALGENPKRSNNNNLQPGQQRRYPGTRMGVEETIRDAFIRAKEYMRDWQEYEARKGSDPTAIAPRRDLQLEALVEILQGKRLIHSHCYRADEIQMLLELGDELGFKVTTLQHVLEGYKVAKEIAAHGAGGSTFSDWWAYKLEAYDAIPYNAAIMTNKGVVVSINSDDDEHSRRLYLEAAKTMKYGGLTEEQALRTVTLNPAMQLKIDKRTGSIDVGKDADFAIFNGHPFSVYSRVEMTIIEGEVYFDRQKDLEMREAIKKEKDELKKKERETRGNMPAGRPTPPTPMPNRDDDDPHKSDKMHESGVTGKENLEVRNDQ